MAKKKDGESARPATASELLSAMVAASETFQSGRYTGASRGKLRGIPLPALCLRWLYQSSVWPEGRMTILAGKQESGKSALLSEKARWVAECDGIAVINGTEGRDIADLRASIMEDTFDRSHYTGCHSNEDWQKSVTGLAKNLLKQDPEARPSLFIGVDSLRGALSEATVASIFHEGCASSGYPAEAKQNNLYFAGVCSFLEQLPVYFVVTNHLRDSLEQVKPGHQKKTVVPGGMGQYHYATLFLEMAKVGDVVSSKFKGRKIAIKTTKNSMSSDTRLKIEAEMLWWLEEGPDGQLVQHTFWDWHKATINLLLALTGDKSNNSVLKRRIKDVIRLETANRGAKGRGVWSHELGVPRSDPVSFREAGAIIESNRELRAALEPVLTITQREPPPRVAAYLDTERQGRVRVGPFVPGCPDEDGAAAPELPVLDSDEAMLAGGFGEDLG